MSRSRRQNLKRLQELDDAVLFVLGRRVECRPSRLCFTIVSLNGLTQGGEHPVMEERGLVRCSPEFASKELRVAGKECR